MTEFGTMIRYTLKEHMRERVYLSLCFFALFLLGASLVVATLAPGQRLKLILDMGLAGIEVVAMLSTVFLTVNLILREMETRTIYLILTHPLPRPVYVLGRFLGTMAAVALGVIAMAVMHAGLLALYGGTPVFSYAAACLAILGKVAVVGVMALFMSLFSSSASTALVFTVFLWALGHFTSEMAYLAQKSGNAVVQLLVWFVQNAAPNLAIFSYKDFIGAAAPPAAWFAWLILYCLCYGGIGLYLSSMLIEHKEF